MCIFLHYLTFTKHDLLIHHNAIVTLVTEQNWQMIDMVVEKEKAGKTMVGQPQAQPQETPREQPEATPAQPPTPIVIIPTPGEPTDEEIPALVPSAVDDFVPDDKLNKGNLDAPIKTESDSSVDEQITEAMVEQE